MGLSTLVIAQSAPAEERLRAALHDGVPDAAIVAAPEAQAELGHAGKPDLIVVELPPGRSAPDAVAAIVQQHPFVPVVAFGTSIEDDLIEHCLRAGAASYLPAHYGREQCALVLRLAALGVGHRPNLLRAPRAEGSIVHGDAAAADAHAHQHRLTPRQIEVLAHAVEGLSNRQIATRLHVTEGVVRLHMSEIYRRLGVERRAEAIVKAMRIKEVIRALVGHGENGKDMLDWLLPHVTHRQLGKGEVIFRKGDPGREMYYLQRGDVHLEEIDVQMRPGEIFGEIGVFAPDHRRTCTARCLTDVDLFCLDSEQVKSMYYLNPQFALHVVTLLARRLMADRDRSN